MKKRQNSFDIHSIFKYVKTTLLLFRAVVKFCSTSRLFTSFTFIFILVIFSPEELKRSRFRNNGILQSTLDYEAIPVAKERENPHAMVEY